MRAVYFERFGEEPVVADVPKPTASRDGVVVRVETTGLCRSDVHAWSGHDSGVALPHVPGHEFVGWVDSAGTDVTRFRVGQRVTVPFVSACGTCPECRSGNAQVCRNQTQPGFTHWGSFAEFVALRNADVNLIAVSDELDAGAAALLGCRFATAFHGLVHQAELQAGEWVVVVGCGGVGLSAIMIALALGARVIAVDVDAAALRAAADLGADETIDAARNSVTDTVECIRALVPDGANVAVDALGSASTAQIAIRSLGIRGRHIQIGLFSENPIIPMDEVIAKELVIRGSHGMAASDYPELVALVTSGRLRPQELISRHISLDAAPAALAAMSQGASTQGVTVIDVGLRHEVTDHSCV